MSAPTIVDALGLGFVVTRQGYSARIVWLLLLLLLIAIFGIGTLLEAAFWTLLILAVVVALIVLAFARLIGR